MVKEGGPPVSLEPAANCQDFGREEMRQSFMVSFEGYLSGGRQGHVLRKYRRAPWLQS